MRFTEEELYTLLAWERVNGPIGPERDDYYFARLGMDVVSPHTKRGKKPKFDDHRIKWDGRKKKQSPKEMLEEAKRITGVFQTVEDHQRRKPRPTPQPRKEVTDGNSSGTDSRTRRRRRRS